MGSSSSSVWHCGNDFAKFKSCAKPRLAPIAASGRAQAVTVSPYIDRHEKPSRQQENAKTEKNDPN
jgi:hypothetical protein